MPAPVPLNVRGAVSADLPALRELAAAALTWDADPRTGGGGLVDLLWRTAAPEYALVAEAGGEVVGFLLGSLGPAPKDPPAGSFAERRGHVNLLAVRADVRRRGIGSALLAAMEGRLLAAGANVLMIGGATPVFAWPGVDVRYTAASCLFESRGYAPSRHGVNMTVELETAEAKGLLATDEDEKRLAAEAITVRRLVESDREPITPWLTAWGGTWVREALSTLGKKDAATYVAVLRDGTADAEYVGFASHGVNRAGWFGPMGTGGELRKLGIGRVLLRRCLADLRAEGHATADICWVGPVAFYARTVDAYVERVFWLYRKEQ